MPFLPAFWIRVELTERHDPAPGLAPAVDHASTWSPSTRSGSVASPFAALQWLPRGYRVGRFWSVPLTLRLQHGEERPLRAAVRVVGRVAGASPATSRARPGIDLDARTRGRLGRYVGPIAFAPSDQP